MNALLVGMLLTAAPVSREALQSVFNQPRTGELQLVPKYRPDGGGQLGIAVFRIRNGDPFDLVGLENGDVVLRWWGLDAGAELTSLREHIDGQAKLRLDVQRRDGGVVVLEADFQEPVVEVLPAAKLANGEAITHGRDEGSGMGRWAVWEQTHWMRQVRSGHRLGFRRAGGGGNPESIAFFLKTRGTPPSSDEQHTVMETWAGLVPFDEQSAADGLAAAPWLRHQAAAEVGKRAPTGVGLLLEAGGSVQWKPRITMLVPQRTSWRFDNQVIDGMVGRDEMTELPHYRVFAGERFKASDAGMSGVLTFTTDARNVSTAVALPSDGGVVWLGKHFGALQPLAKARGGWWFAGSAPLDDVSVTLFHVDAWYGVIRSVRAQASGARVVSADASGVTLTWVSDEGVERMTTQPWRELETLMATPGQSRVVR